MLLISHDSWLSCTYWLMMRFVLCLHAAQHVAALPPLLGRSARLSTCGIYSKTEILIATFGNEHMSKHKSRNADHLLHQSAAWIHINGLACVVPTKTLHRYTTVSIGPLTWCRVSKLEATLKWVHIDRCFVRLSQPINHSGTKGTLSY